MEKKKMSKAGTITFWIIFPLVSLFFLAFTLFYFDLANGPLFLFILELVVLVSAIVLTIILKNKEWYFRLAPLFSLLLISFIIVPFTKPLVEVKSIAYFANPEKTEVMTLRDGDVQGLLNEDKTVRMYAGIPYAKPPVDEYRWKEPVDPSPWEGVRDCSYFAPMAMQSEGNSITDTLVKIYASKGWYPDYNMHAEQPMSEDCLYLNIWRPNNNETNLPILVYIHGGSLTGGSSSFEDYNGEEVAKKGVIMITIAYRLGVFGYFAHEELQNESSNHTTGNYGLLDQIKALEWVNNNASYFGGDKNNITIAGESAGSSSVSAICSSPLASGLFKRAIGESSSIVMKKAPHTYRELDVALKMGSDIMKEMNCQNIEELRKIPASKLIKTKYTNSEMTLDGYALSETPYEAYTNGHNNEEELLNGYNVLEADAFVVPTYLLSPTNKDNILERLATIFGRTMANKIYNLYKDNIEEDAFSAFNEIFSVYWFMHPHQCWSKLALDAGVKVYRYQFTKENHFYGTYHSGELIYAYGNVKRCEYGYRYDDSDRALSETMLNYWVNFAKNGNPNGENLTNWPEYNLTDKKVFELGTNVGLIDDRYLALYTLMDEFMEYSLSNKEII